MTKPITSSKRSTKLWQSSYGFALTLVLFATLAYTHEHPHEAPQDEPLLVDLPIQEFVSQGSVEDQWLRAGNVAYFSRFHRTKSISLPVPVTLIFCGFEGDGNQGLKLEEEDFLGWFEHIEHQLPHLIVPVGEDQTTTDKFETPSSSIQYRFELQVAKLHPLVNTILEDTILWNLRPEEPSTSSAKGIERYYVDAFRFTAVLHDVVRWLGLENQYVLFLLNPKPAVEAGRQVYGYRTGFSDAELAVLRQHADELLSMLQYEHADEPDEPPTASSGSPSRRQRDVYAASEQWARDYLRAMMAEAGEAVPAACSELAEDAPSCLQRLREAKGQTPIADVARTIARHGPQSMQRYLLQALRQPVHEECLVDVWVGHDRVAFIDLTAGPFAWGPVVGGQGVRTEATVPRVPEASQQTGRVAEEAEAYSGLDVAAEVAVLKRYFVAQCSGARGAKARAFCRDLQVRMAELEAKRTARNPLHSLPADRPDSAMLSSAGHADPTVLAGGEFEGVGAVPALDGLLGQLGAVVAGTLRQLVVPPAPLYPCPYRERVLFRVYLVTNHDRYNPRDPHTGFDYELFKHELAKLRLPRQEFSFSIATVSMGHDTALAMAFAAALRSAVVPSLSVDGSFRPLTLLYIDSRVLREHLAAVQSLAPAASEAERAARVIPIVLFSLEYPVPVFVDRHYQAKALSDMVVVVQSNFPEWESRLQCNAKPLYWNLKNPLRAALAATALLLGGVVPTHISYSEAHKAASQNWLWSVGDSPVAYTSSMAFHFSSFQRDQVFRNYVVSALDNSLNLTNRGVRMLQSMKTSRENWAALPHLPLDALEELYNHTRNTWLKIAAAVEALDFPSACALLPALERNSTKFRELCEETVQVLELYACTEEPPSRLGWVAPLSLGFDTAVVLLFLVFRKRKTKIKMN